MQAQNILLNDENTILATEKGLEPMLQVRARRLCEDRINRYYPVWQQLNILRSGTGEEKTKMDQFIEALLHKSSSLQAE